MAKVCDMLDDICDRLDIVKDGQESDRLIELAIEMREIVDKMEIDPEKERKENSNRDLANRVFPYYWYLKTHSEFEQHMPSF